MNVKGEWIIVAEVGQGKRIRLVVRRGGREGGTGDVHTMSYLAKGPRGWAGPTCWGLGLAKGARASMVTTHGEMVVPRFLARKGPRGTYSHFCGGEGPTTLTTPTKDR